MKNILKNIFSYLGFLFITVSTFGGGVLYWLGFCMITGISGNIAKLGCPISLILFSILGFWLAPKFSEKYL